MDTVAQTAMDIAFADDPLPSTLNIVHPRPIKWSTLFASLKDAIQESTRGTFSPRLVSFQEWFSILKSAADRQNHADDLRQLVRGIFDHEVILTSTQPACVENSGLLPTCGIT